jgi:glycosyltransferase involved in cell wall biosynthesis
MRPIKIPPSIEAYWRSSASGADACGKVKQLYGSLNATNPAVSIVIPAYNEEESIVKTLLSLCSNLTRYNTEIIVVNNNSTDRTRELVEACGIHCVDEPKQGITMARNRGLAEATGTYVLNADADTLYPANWINDMVAPLEKDQGVSLTYGRFSFIPIGRTGRTTYFFYEYMTDLVRLMHTWFREEAVNVYGFNSGFRRIQGLDVDSFNHPTGTNEDGWLAVKLRNKGFGKLRYTPAAHVWTTDRRIQIDGGLGKGIIKRIKRLLGV